MRDGIYAVRCPTVKIPHNNLKHSKTRLRTARRRNDYMDFGESIYSMDGDVAPVRELLMLAEKHDAMLIVDEAHGTGVSGASGTWRDRRIQRMTV